MAMKRLITGPGKKKAETEQFEDDEITPKRESIVFLETYRDDEPTEGTSSDPHDGAAPAGVCRLCRALYDYNGDDDDLCFRAGDVICVIEDGEPESWW